MSESAICKTLGDIPPSRLNVSGTDTEQTQSHVHHSICDYKPFCPSCRWPS